MEYIWGDKPRSVTDSTRIDDAIRDAIQAHNDDPEAHLGPGQSLETHRESEIIDHKAESIVNDKIIMDIRNFTAIVNPNSVSDFSTIQEAVGYVSSAGGGKVLIYPGNYNISGEFLLPAKVSLIGVEKSTCIITIASSSSNYIRFGNNIGGSTVINRIENLTLKSNINNLFYNPYDLNHFNVGTDFYNCEFANGGTYIEASGHTINLFDCIVRYKGKTSFLVDSYITCKNSRFIIQTSAGQNYFFDCLNPDDNEYGLFLEECSFNMLGYSGVKVFNSESLSELELKNCSFGKVDPSDWDFRADPCVGNFFRLEAGTKLTFPTNTQNERNFSYNQIIGGTSPNLIINGNNHYIVMNRLKGTPVNNGSNNFIFGNQIN